MANIRKINYAAISDLANKLDESSRQVTTELNKATRAFSNLYDKTEGADKETYTRSAEIIKKTGIQTQDEFEKMIRFLKSIDNAKVGGHNVSGTTVQSSNGSQSLSLDDVSGRGAGTENTSSQNNSTPSNEIYNNLSEKDKVIAEKFKLEKEKADLAKNEAEFYKNKLFEKEKASNFDSRDPRFDPRDPRNLRDPYGRGYDPRYQDDLGYGYGRDRYNDPINNEIDQRFEKLNKLKEDISSKIGELNNTSATPSSSPAPVSGALGTTPSTITPQSASPSPKPLGNDANMPFGQNSDGGLKSMSTDGFGKGFGLDSQDNPLDNKIGGQSADISDLDSMSDSDLKAADSFDIAGLSQNIDPSNTDFSSPVDSVQSDSTDNNNMLRTAGLGALGLGALAAGGAAFYASRKKKKDDNELDTNDEFSNEYKINKDDLDASNFTAW